MYLRPAHTDLHLRTLHKFIQENPLGILTTAIRSPNYPLIQSSHIPFILDLPDEVPEDAYTDTYQGPLGVLRGHVARANPQVKAMIESLLAAKEKAVNISESEGGSAVLEEEIMIIFNKPTHHYVTPKFYTSTKPTTGKVVSTWNYAAVQAYGKMRVFYDATSEETEGFLRRQLDDLVGACEVGIMGYDGEEGREKAWTVNEAPDSYTGLLRKGIIGVEVVVERVMGKWKMSQELTEGDRAGTVKGFKALGGVGDDMARCIEERAKVQEERKAGKDKGEKK